MTANWGPIQTTGSFGYGGSGATASLETARTVKDFADIITNITWGYVT